MTTLDWNLECNGQVVLLFRYEQLEGLSCDTLKRRAARLRDVLASDYKLPLKTSNNCDELIRYILCMQSRVTCDILGSDDLLAVTRKCFEAPEHLIKTEQLRPTTPPRLRSGSIASTLSRDLPAARLSTTRSDGNPVVSSTDLNTAVGVCAASMLEATVNGKLLPLYHFNQLRYLKQETLASRVRWMEDVVGGVWDLPRPTSRRHEDLMIYLLCVQAQLVAHQSEDSCRPRDVLVNGFGAPSDWAVAVENRHDMRKTFLSQRMHYKSKYDDHLSAEVLGLQPKVEFAQESDDESAEGTDPYAVGKTDHLRGDVSVGVGFDDTAMEGYLPKCVGHGKRHIEPEVKSDERDYALWPNLAPDDHLTECARVVDFDGKRDDEIDRGHGRRYMDSFIGEHKGGRVLLRGNF